MKYLKICGVLAIILIAVTFLGVVSAAEVTVGDQQFNIPDGFTEDTDAAKEKASSDSTVVTKVFKNGKKSVTINVVVAPENVKKVTINPRSGSENKTINDVEGYYYPDTHEFEYVNGSSQIIISANGDSILEDFIKA